MADENAFSTTTANGLKVPDVPEMVRNFAETGFGAAQEMYDRFQKTAASMSGTMEGTTEAMRSGVREMQVAAVDAAKANSDATYAFLRDLLDARTPADVFARQSTFLKNRVEAITEFGRRMQDASTKFVSEAAKPAEAMMDAGKSND